MTAIEQRSMSRSLLKTRMLITLGLVRNSLTEQRVNGSEKWKENNWTSDRVELRIWIKTEKPLWRCAFVQWSQKLFEVWSCAQLYTAQTSPAVWWEKTVRSIDPSLRWSIWHMLSVQSDSWVCCSICGMYMRACVCVCVCVWYLWTGRRQDCTGSTWRQTPPSFDQSSGPRQEVWSSTETACNHRERRVKMTCIIHPNV